MTPRQLQILQMRCREGLTNAEVGYALGITEHTVKNHIGPILRELSVPSIAGACYWLGRRDAEIAPGLAALRKDDV